MWGLSRWLSPTVAVPRVELHLVGALASVGPTKRARLLSAARRLLVEAPFSLDGIAFVRIDVVVVHVDGASTAVEHFRGAITDDPEP